MKVCSCSKHSVTLSDLTKFEEMEPVLTKDGRKCIIHTDMVETFTKEPVLKCNRTMERKCHNTYLTFFTPTQEKVCEEYFEKKCKIVFDKKKVGESIRKCIRPQQKICDGTGPEECRTIYETSCTSQVNWWKFNLWHWQFLHIFQYLRNELGNMTASTKCEKLPFDVCGRGCVVREGEEECMDQVLYQWPVNYASFYHWEIKTDNNNNGSGSGDIGGCSKWNLWPASDENLQTSNKTCPKPETSRGMYKCPKRDLPSSI